MGLYNFHPRFAPFILKGTKTHTIRGLRTYPDVVGNVLHLYTGLRTSKAKLLGRFLCIKVETFLMTAKHEIFVDGVKLDAKELDRFAQLDGFRGASKRPFEQMIEFWSGRPLPFKGTIIHWRPKRVAWGVPYKRGMAAPIAGRSKAATSATPSAK